MQSHSALLLAVRRAVQALRCSPSFSSLHRLPWDPQGALQRPRFPLALPGSSAAARSAWARSSSSSGSSSSSSSSSNSSSSSSSTSGGSRGAAPPSGSSSAPPPPTPPAGALAFFLAKKAEFQVLLQRYGWFTGVTYFGVYLVTLGGVYASVRAGLLPVPDVNAVLNDFSAKKALLGDAPVDIPPQWRDFATAWIYTKTTEPLRLVATIVVVPLLAKRLPPGVLAALGVKAAK